MLAVLLAAAEAARLVAVLPFDVKNAKMDAALRATLEEDVRTVAGDILTPRGYTVLTGDTTLSVLAENKIDPAKACDASCSLDAARQLNATLFLSGTVARAEGAYVAFIRLYEVKSGKQLASVRLEGDKVRDLRRQFEAQAGRFVEKALGGPPQAVPRDAPARQPDAPARPPEAASRETQPAARSAEPFEPGIYGCSGWSVDEQGARVPSEGRVAVVRDGALWRSRYQQANGYWSEEAWKPSGPAHQIEGQDSLGVRHTGRASGWVADRISIEGTMASAASPQPIPYRQAMVRSASKEVRFTGDVRAPNGVWYPVFDATCRPVSAE